MIPVGSRPDEFGAFFADQRQRMGDLIKAEGIRVE